MLHRGVIFPLAVILSWQAAWAGPPSCGLEQSRLVIPLGPPGVRVNVAYGQLVNSTGRDVAVVTFRSPAFRAVELHESFIHDGLASMRELKGIAIAPRQALQLEAGGKHLMLMQSRAPLEVGTKIPLEIVGKDGCISILKMTVLRTKS